MKPSRTTLQFWGCSPRFSKEAINFAIQYPWPGNIRQLEKVVKVLAELTEVNEISKAALENQLSINHSLENPVQMPGLTTMFSVPTDHVAGRFQANLEELEQAMVRFAMGQTHNDTQAAKFLGIPRNSLVRRMQEWGWRQSS